MRETDFKDGLEEKEFLTKIGRNAIGEQPQVQRKRCFRKEGWQSTALGLGGAVKGQGQQRTEALSKE